jgi:hypothetical protein
MDPIIDHSLEEFEEYREFMNSNYNAIIQNKFFFITDKYFSTFFKCERLKELLDFFECEEDFEKCAEIKKLYSAVEVDHLFNEVASKMRVREK